ncbi:hypothetical protein HX882_29505 [Pseudomonas gingeri]|uniref:DUF4345 domain-containing protein n=1 Tax=Pseudomonas gingeri TaxID=117681 RepID=A0A7Y7XI01_9PSED|nr:hypothetical protein [Pseudomonas gingeri]NWC00016.1 hypothetical protein [Pseudomonas gingeri]
MKLNFRSLAILCSAIFIGLACMWLLAPNFFLSRWGVAFSDSVGLLGRRASALYLGIGVMFFLARNAEPSSARSALVTGLVVTCLALAALGAFELLTGNASVGILSAVVIEVALALAFLYVARTGRDNPATVNEARGQRTQ